MTVAGTAVPEMIAGERYFYDPAKLTGPSKTTNFQTTYQPGSDRLKGVNSSMGDQTWPILADALAAGLAVVSVLAGMAVGVAAAAGAGAIAGAGKSRNALFGAALMREKFSIAAMSDLFGTLKMAPTTRETQLARLRILLDASASTNKILMVTCTADATTLLKDNVAASEAKAKLAKTIAADTRELDALLAVARIRPLTSQQRLKVQAIAVAIDTALREADVMQKSIDEQASALALTTKAH